MSLRHPLRIELKSRRLMDGKVGEIMKQVLTYTSSTSKIAISYALHRCDMVYKLTEYTILGTIQTIDLNRR